MIVERRHGYRGYGASYPPSTESGWDKTPDLPFRELHELHRGRELERLRLWSSIGWPLTTLSAQSTELAVDPPISFGPKGLQSPLGGPIHFPSMIA